MSDEWKPIATAPKDGTPIYLWAMVGNFDHRWHRGAYSNDWRGKWLTLGRDRVELRHPTHWMPLPSPPKGD